MQSENKEKWLKLQDLVTLEENNEDWVVKDTGAEPPEGQWKFNQVKGNILETKQGELFQELADHIPNAAEKSHEFFKGFELDNGFGKDQKYIYVYIY